MLGTREYLAMVEQGWSPQRIVASEQDALDVIRFSPWAWSDPPGEIPDPPTHGRVGRAEFVMWIARGVVLRDREHLRYQDPPGMPTPWISYEQYWQVVHSFVRTAARMEEEEEGDLDAAVERALDRQWDFFTTYWAAVMSHTAHPDADSGVYSPFQPVREQLAWTAYSQTSDDVGHEIVSVVPHYRPNRRSLDARTMEQWIARIELSSGHLPRFSDRGTRIREDEAQRLLGLPDSYMPRDEEQLALCFDVIRMAPRLVHIPSTEGGYSGRMVAPDRRALVGYGAAAALASMSNHRTPPEPMKHRMPDSYQDWVEAIVHETISDMRATGETTVEPENLLNAVGSFPAVEWWRSIDVVEQSPVDVVLVGPCGSEDLGAYMGCIARSLLYTSAVEQLERQGIPVAGSAKEDIDLVLQWGAGKVPDSVVVPVVRRIGIHPGDVTAPQADRRFWAGEIVDQIVGRRSDEYEDPEELRDYARAAIDLWRLDRQMEESA